jgi:hypothetical protein
LETAIRDRKSKENARAGQLLDAVFYADIHQRMEMIAEAHRGTFEWIWTAASTSHASSFLEFLEHGNGLFWINGKVASGKSTLMKYIVEHHRTGEALRKWTVGARLLTASFYFWVAGTTLEKSLRGILRSLLYQMLSAAPDLIPTVIPIESGNKLQGERSYHQVEYERGLLDLQIDRKDAVLQPESPRTLQQNSGAPPKIARGSLTDVSQRFSPLSPLTEKKLTNMLTKLIALPSLSVVLFIDGLGESDGDTYEIMNVLNMFVKAGAKIVLTTRPWVVFQDAFQDNKGFRLEDHTRADIDLYVRHMFYEHRGFQQLSEHEPMALGLPPMIVEKAAGVFLWVALVTRSLIRGINYFDTFNCA